MQELVTVQFYAEPGSTHVGAILTFSDRERMIEHLGMVSKWEEFERFFVTVKPVDVRVYGRPSKEAEAWIRQFGEGPGQDLRGARSRVRALTYETGEEARGFGSRLTITLRRVLPYPSGDLECLAKPARDWMVTALTSKRTPTTRPSLARVERHAVTSRHGARLRRAAASPMIGKRGAL